MKAKVSPKTVRRSVAQARAFEEAIAKMATDPARPMGSRMISCPTTRRPNLAGTMPPARMAEVERALRLVLNL